MRIRHYPSFVVSLLLLHRPTAAVAQKFIDTRYQYYQEEDGRVRVDSSYSMFSFETGEIKVDGTWLYSAISGASPTGLPGAGRSGRVPVVEFEDDRYAGSLAVSRAFGTHALKLGGSYSYEPDYTSYGASLQDTISLNSKNTELVLGLAYADDEVGAAGTSLAADKKAYDVLVGVNQVLSAETLLRVNVGLSWKDGFLSDPYKRAFFTDEDAAFLEERPDSRAEQVLLGELSHFFEGLDASGEVSLRLGRNDHGMTSTTASVAVTKGFFDDQLILKPSFRYYRQSEADYYGVSFTGNPDYYSADYRVSELETMTLGFEAQWQIIPDKLTLTAGYERYMMRGTDGETSQSAYPDADAVTIGLRMDF